MSKKLFLAAASVAALALAGGAHAGEVSGHFGATAGANNVFSKGATPAADKVYLVASERLVGTGVGTAAATIAGAIVATNELENDIIVGAAARDFLVSFTVTGATVSAPASTVGIRQVTGAPSDVSSSLVGVSNGVVTYLVSIKGSAVDAFTLNATVTQAEQASISVSSKVAAIIGGTNIDVDEAGAVVAAKYAPKLKNFTAKSYELVADLPDYLTVNGAASETLADSFLAANSGTFHKDLNGTPATYADILADDGLVTVKGPLISEAVTVSMAGTPVVTTDANTAIFKLNATQSAGLVAGGGDLSIAQTAVVADKEAFRAGTYRMTWAPKAMPGYSVPAASTADAGVVTLDGTNFIAPWVSGTGLATSVIRIGNSNNVASGAVSVRLLNAVKVVAGVATPVTSTVVYDAGVVPANGDLQITSDKLVGAFGDFTRGDVQITINSLDAGFTAKMRSTRDGQTFEQSLAD